VGSKSRFQRSFLIFQKEDPGYGVGQGPSGYIKIEVRDGKGKLSAAVQNLRDGQDMYIYKLYLIEPKEIGPKIAYVGVVPVEGNKGELKWTFDPDNVAMTGSSIDRFTVAALIVENKNRKAFQVICPMAAYRDKKTSWREGFRRTIDVEAMEQNEINAEDKDLASPQKQREDIRNEEEIDKEEIAKNEVEYNTPEENEFKEREAEEDKTENSEISRNELKEQEVNPEKHEEKYEMDKERESEADGNTSVPEEQDSGGETEQARNLEFVQNSQNSNEGDMQASHDEAGQVSYCETDRMSGERGEQSSAFGAQQTTQNGIGCMMQNNGLCGIPLNGNVIPCATCNLNKMENTESIPGNAVVDLKKLEASFNRYFEKFDPFQNKRRDYKWWKVGSPVHLNNILYQHNIRTPLLFNPAVMMSHFKYRHMIVGIYRDDIKKLRLIVCGIPAVYDSDTRPFGNMCRWAQLDVGRPRYGAFGYWLVYIDPETGKFLNMG